MPWHRRLFGVHGLAFLRGGMTAEAFRAAIANLGAFIARIEAAELAEDHRQTTHLYARMATRRLRERIATLPAGERREADERLAAIEAGTRPARPHEAPLEELEAWHMALLDLEDALRQEQDETSQEAESSAQSTAPSAEKQQDMTSAADSDGRCHIQPTSNRQMYCISSEAGRAAPAAPRPPVQRGEAAENYRKEERLNRARSEGGSDGAPAGPRVIDPGLLARFTPAAMRDLACDDAALYLDAFQDWHDAVPMILREFGINPSAWIEACDVLGETEAFIALLVIGRNRFHPVTPVRSPGGMLRSFTARALTGELNLTGAVIGIRERDRQGRQPRSTPGGRRRR